MNRAGTKLSIALVGLLLVIFPAGATSGKEQPQLMDQSIAAFKSFVPTKQKFLRY